MHGLHKTVYGISQYEIKEFLQPPSYIQKLGIPTYLF